MPSHGFHIATLHTTTRKHLNLSISLPTKTPRASRKCHVNSTSRIPYPTLLQIPNRSPIRILNFFLTPPTLTYSVGPTLLPAHPRYRRSAHPSFLRTHLPRSHALQPTSYINPLPSLSSISIKFPLPRISNPNPQFQPASSMNLLLEEDLPYSSYSQFFQELEFPMPTPSPPTTPTHISLTTDDSEEEPATKKRKQRGGEEEIPVTPPRRLWVKDRSRAWWDMVSHPDFPDSDFRREFRMSRSTFDLICNHLSSAVAKEDTTLRSAVPVPQRVAVCLSRLATGHPLRLISKRFGLGISTCHKLILEVCSAIRSLLMPKFLAWNPDPAAFESAFGIPNVLGAMYTTHIPIIAPKDSVSAYFNRRHTERNQKTSYSVTLQGVVGTDGTFTDVCIGWPGSMSDDRVLENSSLYSRASAGGLESGFVVGGPGYPLLDWLLVPYKHPNLTWTQHAFNGRIGEASDVARNAFARLKGRWACLQKRTEVKLQDLPLVLGACCVLHNICEMRKEEMGTEMEFELVDDEMVADDDDVVVRSESAVRVRDGIAHDLLHSGRAGTNFV